MGGAEGTKLDLDFMDMERVCEILYHKKFEVKFNHFNYLFIENGCYS